VINAASWSALPGFAKGSGSLIYGFIGSGPMRALIFCLSLILAACGEIPKDHPSTLSPYAANSSGVTPTDNGYAESIKEYCVVNKKTTADCRKM
jgi:hypothetical protein